MRPEELDSMLARDPFVPLRIHTTDHRKVDVPFRHVVVFQKNGAIVFKGVKNERSQEATGYEFVAFDRIDRVEQRNAKSGNGRKRRAG